MKSFAVGIILGLLGVAAQASDVPAEASVVPVPAVTAGDVPTDAPVTPEAAKTTGLPAGVVTTTHPLKRAFLEQSKSEPTVYRPNPNMPEILNEDVIRGMRQAGENPGNFSEFVGHLPRLVVLPCAKGCEGEDYEKVVAAFVRGYRGQRSHFVERGEMLVQVRWVHRRSFMARQLPYGADVFGISFLYEGKLVSIGRSAGVGNAKPAERLAEELGGRFAVELALTAGMGAKPLFLKLSDAHETVAALMDTTSAVNEFLGAEDVRSRIEPATVEAHKHLMPAIDGIAPGEVAPITEPKFVYNLM